jgi:hypothetical protein
MTRRNANQTGTLFGKLTGLRVNNLLTTQISVGHAHAKQSTIFAVDPEKRIPEDRPSVFVTVDWRKGLSRNSLYV